MLSSFVQLFHFRFQILVARRLAIMAPLLPRSNHHGTGTQCKRTEPDAVYHACKDRLYDKCRVYYLVYGNVQGQVAEKDVE